MKSCSQSEEAMKKFILWGGTLVQTHNTVARSKTGTILTITCSVRLGVNVFYIQAKYTPYKIGLSAFVK